MVPEIPAITVPIGREAFCTNCPIANPFADGTYLEFKLDKPGKYQISILDVNGRKLRKMSGDTQLSTAHSLYWDGSDDNGKAVASGVYFYRLECEGFSQMKRMVKM